MADGMSPAAEAGGTLYERDFYAWTQAQAAALRAAGTTDPTLDYENLAEEIETLGRSDRQEIESRIATIIEHLFKLEASAVEPRPGWRRTVREAWRAAERVMKDSPSLQRQVREFIESEMPQAVRDAAATLADHGEDARVHLVEVTLVRGYTEEQVLGDWWPDAPRPGA